MQALITGEIADTEANPWEMGGRAGIAYGAFIKGGKRDQPQRVRLTEAQFQACIEGMAVEWPVTIVAKETNYGSPKLQVTLDQDFVIGGGLSEHRVRQVEGSF